MAGAAEQKSRWNSCSSIINPRSCMFLHLKLTDWENKIHSMKWTLQLSGGEGVTFRAWPAVFSCYCTSTSPLCSGLILLTCRGQHQLFVSNLQAWLCSRISFLDFRRCEEGGEIFWKIIRKWSLKFKLLWDVIINKMQSDYLNICVHSWCVCVCVCVMIQTWIDMADMKPWGRTSC